VEKKIFFNKNILGLKNIIVKFENLCCVKAKEGDSPVSNIYFIFMSKICYVKICLNIANPFAKPKYC